MEDIEQRLKETSDTCLTCFKEWQNNKKDNNAQAALQEAVHELRKVASRLEIELAINERDEKGQKPIKIPHHRSKNRSNNDDQESLNRNNDAGAKKKTNGGSRRPKRSSGGSGGNSD